MSRNLLHIALSVKTTPFQNNLNLRIEIANALTPKPITTQEATISVIESWIKSIGPTLTYCEYINHQTNEICHGQGVFRLQDDVKWRLLHITVINTHYKSGDLYLKGYHIEYLPTLTDKIVTLHQLKPIKHMLILSMSNYIAYFCWLKLVMLMVKTYKCTCFGSSFILSRSTSFRTYLIFSDVDH